MKDTTSRVKPRLSLLTNDQKDQIHAYALEILARTGVRVDSEPVRGLLEKRLGASAVKEKTVRLPGEAVEWALKAAPSRIEIFDRRGGRAFQVGDGSLHFGIGVTTLFYQDPTSGDLVPFTRKHMQDMVRLGGRLPGYEVISTVGIVQDVPTPLSDLYGSLEMLVNTTKPLVLLVSDEGQFSPVLDLVEHLQGDLSS
jgi:trimethylamine--corrinoid protein Co-methyltransferase